MLEQPTREEMLRHARFWSKALAAMFFWIALGVFFQSCSVTFEPRDWLRSALKEVAQ